ncbi:MAG: hypothetical protein AAF593_01625 [Planctomycetota bacterium]
MGEVISEAIQYWTTPRDTARIHLLPAMKAPVVAVLRRRPNKVWHVMRWDLRQNHIAYGSWFRGTLYPHRCDVSWDGRWMVYLALGSDGDKSWNAVCRLPWLKAYADVPNVGTWAGGGFWSAADCLTANTHWHADRALGDRGHGLPFRIERLDSGGETFPILDWRLRRDGWEVGNGPEGVERKIKTRKAYSTLVDGDPGWSIQPTRKHPRLEMFYRGYLERGYTFEFVMTDHPQIVDYRVEWAAWAANGDLVLTREGVIERYSLKNLRAGQPSFRLDLNALRPRWAEQD